MTPTQAQPVAQVRFEWANAAEAAEILGANDAYVRQTAPLERMAKTRSAVPVDTPRFLEHMRSSVKAWTPRERERVEKLLGPIRSFAGLIAVRQPERVLLIRTDASLEDSLPHTRADAIVLTESAFENSDDTLSFILVHEYFHVLTRYNPKFRETAYGLLGFQRCKSVSIHPNVEAIRITNPDTPFSEHVLTIQRQGRELHLLPYLVFNTFSPDTVRGFSKQISFPWLVVDKSEDRCVFLAPTLAGNSLVPSQSPEVLERVGRNTNYLFHPEEVLADNFALLFQVHQRKKGLDDVPSPGLLEKFKTLLATKD